MKSNNIKYIEDSLKRYIKKSKDVSYSTALLVAFLITGFVSYSSEPVQMVSTRAELAEKILNEKFRVSTELKETEKSIKDIDLKIEKLMRRGAFWVKPLEDSYQIFFNGNWHNYSKNKNRTKFNFKGLEYTSSPSFLSSSEKETYYDGIYYGAEGIIKNPLEFTDSIDFGANISPKKVEEVIVIPPTVRKTEVKLAQITAPAVPDITVTAPVVTAPTAGALVTPTAPSINVTAPAAITPLGQITVTEIAPLNINVTTPTISEPLAITAPTVQAPATPAGFTPRLITPPSPPNQPIINLPTLPNFSAIVQSSGNGTANTVDLRTQSNGVIEMVALTSGDFNLKRTAASTWVYEYKGYSGANVWAVGNASSDIHPVVTPNGTWNSLARASTTSGGGQLGFQKLVGGSTQSTMLSNANFLYTRELESSTTNLGEFVHLDIHGAASVTTQRTGLVTATNSLSNKQDILDAYDDAGKINWTGRTSDNSNRYTWMNSGKIIAEGGNMSITNHYDHTSNSSQKALAINSGEIIFQPYFNGANYFQKYNSVFVMSLDGNQVHHIMYNSPKGKIITYTGTTSVFLSNSSNSGRPLSIVNRGNIEMYGENSAGIYIKTGSKNDIVFTTSDFAFNNANNTVNSGSYKPIKLFGDNSIGLYQMPNATGGEIKGNFAVDLGEAGKGNQNFTTDNVSGKTNGTKITNHSVNSGNNENIEKTFGIIAGDLNLNSHQINIFDKTEGNVGVFPNLDKELKLGGGEISLKGGNKNIAIMLQRQGSATSNGNISLTGGVGNMAISAQGGNSSNGGTNPYEVVTINKITANNTEDSLLIFADMGAKVTVGELNATSKVGSNPTSINKKDTGIAYAVGKNSSSPTTITINRTVKPSSPNITITGSQLTDKDSYVGFGLMAKDGGLINAKNNNIKVVNGSTVIASIGADSKIDLTGSTLEYDGLGYAIYSDGQGKVDISGAELNLAGKSTAFDVDLGAGTLPITLDGNTRIKANSDDVIVFNLKRATGLTTVGGIEDSIKNQISAKLGGGINLNNLFTGSTSTKYKVAAVDGGSITLGNLDKTGKGDAGETIEQKEGHQYFNRFLGQRLVATTNAGSTISAILSSADATARYNGQVVGLEMNSSKNATSVNEAGINLVNSTLKADRTDAGTGAVGAFINYGKVTVDAASKILVEKEANTVNDKAAGIYAVNGSVVENKGEVAVGGNQSIGILGMAYRLDNSNSPIVDEFGAAAVGQGKVNITNAAGSKILMSGENTIGIYADNNKTGSAATDHNVVNKGNIEVGKSSGTSTSIGIYAKGVSVKPEFGKISIGEKAIGIYALDSEIGEAGKDLGTVEFKDEKGIAIYLTGDQNKTKLNGTKVTLANPNSKKESVGIFIDHTSNTVPYETAVQVDTGSSNNITAYYTKSGDLKVKANGKINENSIGITGAEGKKLTYGDGASNFTFEVGKNSTGILAKKSEVELKEKATVKLTGENSTGIYSDSDKTNKTAKISGKIEFDANAKNSIGVYALNGTDVRPDASDTVNFGSSKNNIGIYLAGSNYTGIPTSMNITYAHNSNNIYLYAQGSKASDGTLLGSTVKPYAAINVSPTGKSTATEKAIGIYLDTAVKGEVGKFVDNDLNLEEAGAELNVSNEGIGAYAKNTSTNEYNKITLPKISSDGDKTVGVYTDGNLKLVRTGNISASNKGIGIYANKGKIALEDVQRIALTKAGTGIYLTNGTYLDGNKIELKNNTAGTAAAGVYYTKGSVTSQVTHNTEIEVNDGNDALALYIDGGIDLKNNKDITISKNKGNVATFITGNSKFTNDANITLEGAGLTQALGVYVQNGEATNNVGKSIKVKDETAGSLSVGMAAVKSATGTKATVNNAGAIEVTGDAIAMYVDNDSSGTNSGTITVKNSGNMKAIGAYVKGNNAAFSNTGKISSENIALALEDTTAGKITSGNIELTANNAVGIYAKNSVIDFDVTATTTKEKTVALFAQGNTKISKTVTSAAGKGHVGVYVKDSNVKFETGSKVVVNNGVGTDFGVGIFTDKAFSGDIKTTIEQNGSETIGLFLGSDGGAGSTVNYTGNIKAGNGIGVYVPTNSKFVSTNTAFDINGGTAVYLKGGEVDLGSTGKATINFGAAGGTAIYQDGGIINTGAGLTINGSGSFLALKNANSTINSLVKVGANGIGINSTYDAKGTDYQLSLGSTGKIQLNGDKATGIAATVALSVAPNKVIIKNEGIIETTSGFQTVGIFAKGAHVENSVNAKINIGEKGIGIFTTNDGANIDTVLKNNGEINLLGNEAIGILANKTTTDKAFIGGKITGSKDSQIGIYVKDNTVKTTVKDFTISLGTNAKGLVFDSGNSFIVDTSGTNNKITTGDTTDKAKRGIGIGTIGTNGVVNNTDVTIGTDSLGLYAKGGKIEFNSGSLKSSTGSSILAYADKAGTIELNGTGPLSVGTNGIALGTNGGKIDTNATTLIEVNGTKGIGAFVVGDAANAGEISNKFEVKVKSADGIGVYAKGNVNSFAKVTEIKGNSSKGYIFDSLTKAATVSGLLQLNDASATDQIGVYATGTGAGLTTNGISVIGRRNIGIYNKANQSTTNNGVLTVGDSIADNSSIGIFSDNSTENTTARTIATNDLVTVGKNSVGIYGKNIGVTQSLATKDVTVASKGIGILVENTATYYGKGNVSVAGKVNVGADEAIGIQTENANVTLSKDLIVGANNSKGVFSTEKGNISIAGDITVGKDSIGIYKKGTGIETIQTASGKTLTVGEKGYGIFAENAKVENKANITVGKNGLGIYGTGADLSSTGNVTVGESGIGLYLKSDGTKTLTSTGVHTIGNKKAIGLYAENANIETKAGSSMTIGDDDSVGIFSKGAGNVTTNGDITVGKSSIGIYKDGKGELNIGNSGQQLNVAEKGYGIYYIGAGKTNSKIQSNMDITLAKESVGTYAKNATVIQNGNITVGETNIGSDGYANPDSNKNSIGIFADTSDVSYKGTMLVDKPLSVGIYGRGAGTITLRSGATVNVKNGAIGIMTGQGVSAINIENGATINVSGKAKDVDSNASDKNVSFGITAYSGVIDNKGTISVSGGATGIYLGGTASLLNGATGTIIIDPSGGTSIGKPTTKTDTGNIGGIRITDVGKVTINERVITGGTVKIKGDLNMQGMGLDISTGKILVDAKNISGTAYIIPNFSKGNSEQKITIKDVFKVAPDGIGAFTGDVKSKSISWIAKISKEFSDTTTKDITLARIPYNALISGEKYKNLAAGLEEIRLSIPSTQNSDIFKSLDKISDHGTFARAVADMRGDVYSNIQERMKTVENVFEKSYSELLNSYNVTKDVNKFSVIHSQGKHKDDTLGVTGYKYKSLGMLYLNDREAFSYGGKYGWSAGLIGSDFDFEGRTNKGSSEKVISGKIGLHYQKALDRKDDDAQLKYLSRLELTVNKHKTKRNLLIGNDSYHNKASYYSADLSWKNKVFYDYDVNTKWSFKPYAALDLSYGHIWNISESGNGIRLDVKGKDYFVVSPNVGVETKYIIPVGETNRVVLKADAKASYDVTELYERTNTAKIKDTSKGYYDLSRPEKRRAEGKVGVEIGLEKTDNYGVTFRAEYTGSRKSDMNYGVRFNYKF
ncbi:autotransporter adhesin RadD [Fusobacterium russii]|uniref:autotransporter adhesin RadD n=1 Tax=Fusobacterium russii TaxID=854 RepID=UPI00039B9579|nr:autotransporter-associated N-terminal domain-containing protein [Fusobacterium russii]